MTICKYSGSVAKPPNIATPSMTEAMEDTRTVRLLNSDNGSKASAPIRRSMSTKAEIETIPTA